MCKTLEIEQKGVKLVDANRRGCERAEKALSAEQEWQVLMDSPGTCRKLWRKRGNMLPKNVRKSGKMPHHRGEPQEEDEPEDDDGDDDDDDSTTMMMMMMMVVMMMVVVMMMTMMMMVTMSTETTMM